MSGVGIGSNLGGADAAEFAVGIGGLTKAGLPLPDGLRALGHELSEGSLKRAMLDLADRLDEGLSLDKALQALDDRVPPHLRGLIRAGEASGRLSEVLTQYVAYRGLGTEMRRKLTASLAYPLLLLIGMFAVFVAVSYLVTNHFAPMFSDFGIQLPAMTVAILAVCGLVAVGGWRLPFGVVMLVALGFFGLRTLVSPPMRRRTISTVPLIGPIWRYTALAEFCHLLALLLESGMTVPESLPLAAEGAGDEDLATACRAMTKEVSSGAALSQAIGVRGVFPPGLAQVLRWSEDRQGLPEALHMAGEMFEGMARSQTEFAGGFLGILVVLMVLWGIAFVVIALFMPLFHLISALSGFTTFVGVMGGS